MTGSIRTFLTYLNFTSLDAPLVVTFWYAILAIQFQHQPTLEIVWLLFSTTWVVYALDRIFESEVSLTRSRHQFHRRYRTLFLSLVTIVMLLNCLIIWWLPLPIALYKGGILLGAASAAYILQPHLNISPTIREWIKNLLVTFVFASGAILPVWVHLQHDPRIDATFGINAISLYILTLSSLRAIELAENEKAPTDPTPFIALILLILFAWLNQTPLGSIWLISGLLTFVLVKWVPREKLPPGAFDFVLLFPAAILLIMQYSLSSL